MLYYPYTILVLACFVCGIEVGQQKEMAEIQMNAAVPMGGKISYELTSYYNLYKLGR